MYYANLEDLVRYKKKKAIANGRLKEKKHIYLNIIKSKHYQDYNIFSTLYRINLNRSQSK